MRFTGAIDVPIFLLLIFSFGNLRAKHAMRSLELFSRDVMPKLKAAVK